MDLGTGDGRLIALVKRRFPDAQAIGLDSSTPMLERAGEHFATDPRIDLCHHDLNLPLPDLPPVDAIVSGLAIHHVEDQRKQTLFAETRALPRPGGVFANLELVTSATPEIHQRFRREIGRVEDDPADRLANLSDQLRWLRASGFDSVDCHFKWPEPALIVATRDR